MNVIEMLKNFNTTKLEDSVEKVNEKLSNIVVTGESGGGVILVTINGHGKIVDIHIDDSLMHLDKKEILRDLMIAAINAGYAKKEEKTKEVALENMMSFLPNILENFDKKPTAEK